MRYEVTLYTNNETPVYSDPIPKEGRRGINKIGDSRFIITLKRNKTKCCLGICLAIVLFLIYIYIRHIIIAGSIALILFFTFCAFCQKNTIEFSIGSNNLLIIKTNGCCCCLNRYYYLKKGEVDRLNFYYSSFFKGNSSTRYYRYSVDILTYKSSIDIFNITVDYPAFTQEEIDDFSIAVNTHIKNRM